jgi:beta-fructofuranosidase
VRPQFHLTAEHGWVNDPHAITFHEGKYHVFYQYVPDTMVWASNCHWGHAVGDDLISLTRLPVAIAPGDGDDGIWTGSLATDPAGRSTIFYTSVQEPGIGIGRIRTATPTDDSWLSWVKGPVIIEAPTDLDVVAYRDPFVFGDGDGWRMFVGAGLADGRATALAYSSPDLADWRYDGIAAERSTTERTPVWMGALWECPQLFEIDGRHVLVSSVWDDDILYYAGYGIGTYADGRFVAETWGQLTYGPSYYAPSFFRDRDGRPCLTLWMRGVRDADEGWAGAHSIPHLLRLDGDRLVASPHPDLDSYRGKPVDDGVETPGLALDAVWSPKRSDAALGFRSAGRPTLAVSIAAGILTIAAGDERWTMPYDGGDVRVILDGPAAEVSTSAGIFGCEVAPAGVGYETVGDVADAQIRSLTQN